MVAPENSVPFLPGSILSRNPTIWKYPLKRTISATTRACPEAPQITKGMDLVSDFRFMMLRAIIPKDDEMTGKDSCRYLSHLIGLPDGSCPRKTTAVVQKVREEDCPQMIYTS
jgi:hypothetical protein